MCVVMFRNFQMVLMKTIEAQELHLCYVLPGLTGGFMVVDPLNKFACRCTYPVSIFISYFLRRLIVAKYIL